MVLHGRLGARLSAGCIVASLLLAAAPSDAHELRPAMLRVDLVEAGGDSKDILVELHLRLPPQVSSAAAEAIQPRLPPACVMGPPEVAAGRRSWRGRCQGGMPAGPLEIEGLGRGLEVVVDLRRAGAPATTAVLHDGATSLHLGAKAGAEAGAGSGASGYLALGVEHILGGLDHLLFVVGLVLLGLRSRLGGRASDPGPGKGSPAPWRSVVGILALLTAFTVAHSLTLAAAALGWLRLPGAPVEACIALSIVLLAREVVRPEPRMRSPWGFAFACGLLHGLGFAGALAQVGLPSEAIVEALLLFNVGVELGQVVVALATVLGLGLLVAVGLRLFGAQAPRSVRVVLGTALGSLAVAWTLERVLSMVT